MSTKQAKEQLFQRYNKSVMVVFAGIMLLTFMITLYNYYLAKDQHRREQLQKMQSYTAQLNKQLQHTEQTLTAIRDLAQYYLRYPAELASQPLAFRQEGKYFYLDKSRQNIAAGDRIISGNITGIGRIDSFDQALNHELIMANALTPAFVAAQQSIKEANWLYYNSLRRFINLYPWLPRSIWQYSEQSLDSNLLEKIKASKQLDDKFWSPPYLDSAGKGLSTTLGMGVYVDRVLKGVMQVDISTEGLASYLPQVSTPERGYILIDQQSQVILHKTNASPSLSAQALFADVVPTQLQHLHYQQLEQQEASTEVAAWHLQQTSLPINGWLLVEYQKKSNFYRAINTRFFTIFVSMFFGLLSLLVVVYYVTHRTFITPSKKFISHIENCSAGDPGKIKPSVEWQHWFKIVEDLFGENRSLMQRLKDQNNELDCRVKEKTQALLDKSEQHQRDYALLRSVMDAIPDYTLFNDQQGQLIGCNQSIEQLLQQNETDILGAKVRDIIAPVLGKAIAYSIDNGGAMTETRHQTISNDEHSHEVYQAPFYGEHGSLLGSIVLIRDVTRQVEINRAMERAKNQAEAANQIKSQFLANMSHEIRTPINAIQGMFLLLQQSPLNKVQQQYLSNAEAAAVTLLYLVNELLDSAKVESGNMTIHKEQVALDSLIAQALNLNIAALTGKALDLTVAIDSQVPLHLHTDTMRVVQVLSNLLNNAIKFTEQGSVTLRVTLAPAQQGEQTGRAILFRVKDTGIGIEQSKQSVLFEAFKQADESMTRVYGGTGLGLSICQHIAELLGGEITVTSTLGQGAEFTLVLPLAEGNEQVSGDDLTKYQAPMAHCCFFNLAVALPDKLRENFADIGQQVTAIAEVAQLSAQDNDKAAILFIDGSSYEQGFTDKALQLIAQNVTLLALCQPVAARVSVELLAQLNQHQINYLLLEMPLYRQVIPTFVEELASISLTDKVAVNDEQVVSSNNDESLNGLSILLVEDNLVNQLVAVKLLESMQAQVLVAENGQVALDMLPTVEVDVILMDIQMPVMDGLTATQRIKALPEYAGIPIIAMTAHAREEDKQQCLAAGMDYHIAKPISPVVLKASILQLSATKDS
ncbi:Signal transduction histidine kinase [Colwellia chukchiensis]|uniref:histidine kinase n=1 Tax=Colwellia chukchiensis TaxID=641665 RepID=A0A1H7I2E8_9GAMM|nr:ATP-binding protein [Colwellia chukchiensis]SEK56007.1 Signal transduction histidine kinase [Colwellia chukchiensis]